MNTAKWIGVIIALVILANLLVYSLDAWLGGGCIVTIPGLCETPPATQAEVQRSQAASEPTQEPSAGPIVDDDFSDPASGWREDNDADVSLEYTERGYRIVLKKPGLEDSRLNFGSAGQPVTYGGLRVEADAEERAGPRTSGVGDTFEFHGVACWGLTGTSAVSEAYKFVITPVGHYGILKEHLGATGWEILTEGDGNFGGFGATNRIRGDCVPTGEGATSLVLYIDGRKVAEATDPDGLDRFSAIGLTVETSEGGTDVLFDNVVARGLKTKTPSEGLCKQDGIRYVGTTAQGAEVCFTLTPDRSAWVEIRFSFVRASGCSDMATGTAYNEGPASLDGPGRIEIAGFKANINGGDVTKASGVFADSEICPGKKFKWSARLQP